MSVHDEGRTLKLETRGERSQREQWPHSGGYGDEGIGPLDLNRIDRLVRVGLVRHSKGTNVGDFWVYRNKKI